MRMKKRKNLQRTCKELAKNLQEELSRGIKEFDLKDFIAFRTMITPALLIAVYSVGVAVIPLILLWFAISEGMLGGILLGIVGVVCAELIWRIIFEMGMVWFRMHDDLAASRAYLEKTSNKSDD